MIYLVGVEQDKEKTRRCQGRNAPESLPRVDGNDITLSIIDKLSDACRLWRTRPLQNEVDRKVPEAFMIPATGLLAAAVSRPLDGILNGVCVIVWKVQLSIRHFSLDKLLLEHWKSTKHMAAGFPIE